MLTQFFIQLNAMCTSPYGADMLHSQFMLWWLTGEEMCFVSFCRLSLDESSTLESGYHDNVTWVAQAVLCSQGSWTCGLDLSSPSVWCGLN